MSQTRVIFSIMLGKDPMFYYTKKMLQHYAKKTHSDLIILDHIKLAPPAPLCNNQRLSAWYQKKYIRDLQKRYDRVLYMDADIIITPWAKNIFEEYPDTELSKTFIYNELLYLNQANLRSHMGPNEVNTAIKQSSLLNINPELLQKYFNAGVILVGRNSTLLQNWDDNELIKIAGYSGSYEQTYINYLAIKNNHSIQSISDDYNRMPYLGLPKSWLGINFVHFAGGGYFKSRKGNRPYYFRKLYLQLHKTKETLPRCTVFYGQHLYFRLKRKLKNVR